MYFIFKDAPPQPPSPLWQKIDDSHRLSEEAAILPLLNAARQSKNESVITIERARELVKKMRTPKKKKSSIDKFLKTYDLSTEEGVVLMCLAEALLRIPDTSTQDALIKDKIGSANWQKHLGVSDSTFVNAGTWALMLSGQVLKLSDTNNVLARMVAQSGEPVIRKAIKHAMKILGQQFVMGRTIKEALKRAQDKENKDFSFSFDMLGEAARTAADAKTYLKSYLEAISTISRTALSIESPDNPGISVKLSALHPRYEFGQKDIYYSDLRDRIYLLCQRAAEANIGLTIDAEESDRLIPSLEIIEDIFLDPTFKNWKGLGLAVQAYQKRAFPLIDWLADLAKRGGRPLMIRLVKGAYWDTEIKHTQELGVSDYPVFTRKSATDVSYHACAAKIFAHGPAVFFPQFATHNALTIAYIEHLVEKHNLARDQFEYQRLHGMGENLYTQLPEYTCRVYAPVGSHESLLAYLVRRLLENGANTSFVNRVEDETTSLSTLLQDPVALLESYETKKHPRIPLPRDLFGKNRLNSEGKDLADPVTLHILSEKMNKALALPLTPGPLTRLKSDKKAKVLPIENPANQKTIGHVIQADERQAHDAVDTAAYAFETWQHTTPIERAEYLEKTADLLEKEKETFYALAILEAGKTLPDAVAEVRETVDFLRYYATQAREKFITPVPLPGPTGESNHLLYQGRGPFVCISPWNFPLAIFTGQIAAALAAGNTVIAKPANQTPTIGSEMVKLFHQAGIPKNVLHFIPGPGAKIGGALVSHPKVAGVAITGSTATAHSIQLVLAKKKGPLVPLIAETGGQNACIVDSSALLEQATDDIIRSAFISAGQRCSALRVLYVQNDIAKPLLTMIKGAMDGLTVGNPALLSTDVGPIIDKPARNALQNHLTDFKKRILHQTPLEERRGYFLPPTLVELKSIDELANENFGPVLHVIRYKAKDLHQVIEEINSTGYGLTCGIHTRIEGKAAYIAQHIKAGNIYINRNMIGAIVGSQPFGGQGLSGAGPKAGGPNYLSRFSVEKVVSTDTTAAGGNASLMSLGASGKNSE